MPVTALKRTILPLWKIGHYQLQNDLTPRESQLSHEAPLGWANCFVTLSQVFVLTVTGFFRDAVNMYLHPKTIWLNCIFTLTDESTIFIYNRNKHSFIRFYKNVANSPVKSWQTSCVFWSIVVQLICPASMNIIYHWLLLKLVRYVHLTLCPNRWRGNFAVHIKPARITAGS